MAEHSAFEKIHIDEKEKSNFEGLLEQLNLPPAIVNFYRENKTLVKVVSATVIVAVVAWALYNSYSENRIEKASSALSAAMELEGEKKLDALESVAAKFSSTSSGMWAEVNQAHELAKMGKIDEALRKYLEIKNDVADDQALFPLVTLSIAQMNERKGVYAEAEKEYEVLKKMKGYESIGYLGAAKILEMQDKNDDAVAVYQEYLNDFAASIEIGEKALIEAKIARIKAAK